MADPHDDRHQDEPAVSIKIPRLIKELLIVSHRHYYWAQPITLGSKMCVSPPIPNQYLTPLIRSQYPMPIPMPVLSQVQDPIPRILQTLGLKAQPIVCFYSRMSVWVHLSGLTMYNWIPGSDPFLGSY